MTSGISESARESARLSRGLSEFLIELSIAVHRFAMYPPGHPSLRPASENVLRRLGDLLAERSSLSIGVARAQLVIEGVATDPKHPVLSDLAHRLHEEHLGAVNFHRGVTMDELEAMLETLSTRSDEETPLGLRPREELPEWKHLGIHAVGYDQLRLRSDGGETEIDRATQLWLGLAQAAMASDDPVAPDEAPDPVSLARTIAGHEREVAYDQVIVGYLLQLAEELKKEGGTESERIRRQVSGLVEELDEETLTRLVEMGGNSPQHRRFVLDASQSLEVESVMKILRTSARSRRQDMSTSLTRLLQKLAMQAERGSERVRVAADTQLREHVEDLLDDWELEDPNPSEYTRVLDAIARSGVVFEGRMPEDRGPDDDPDDGTAHEGGAHRVVRMAIEVSSWGPTVERAVDELVEEGEVDFLLELVEDAPDNTVSENLRAQLSSPSQLLRFLSAEDVEEGSLQRVVDRMGEVAIDPLLRGLSESGSRSVRRKIFDVLAEMGAPVTERAVKRLVADPRWFVQRNMLALLQRFDTLPGRFDPAPYLEHADARVRREALPLVFRVGEGRVRALARALGDRDERMVRIALIELERSLPETLVPTVVNRVVKGDHSPEIRAFGVRVLGQTDSSLALSTLLDLVVEGRSLLGRPRLADPTPATLAGLSALATRWASNEKAGGVLEAAGRSRDPRIRAAVEAS